MERSLLIGGFGGQGIQLCGKLLCYTACEGLDMFATFMPAYGKQQRGGTSSCYVTLADTPIGAPIPEFYDDVMVFNQPSLEEFECRLKPGGVLYLNSSIISKEPVRTDIRVVKIPGLGIAEELKSEKVLNIVMAGGYLGYTQLMPAESFMKTAEKKLGQKRPQLIPLNNAAFTRGYEIGAAVREAHAE